MKLEQKINDLKAAIKNASQDVVMQQTLKSMKRVLRRCAFFLSSFFPFFFLSF